MTAEAQDSAAMCADRVRRQRENVEHHLAQLIEAARNSVKHGYITLASDATVEEYALQDLAEWAVAMLSRHMPVIAGPWRVVDMRDGEPTKMIRESCVDGRALVSVRRGAKSKRDRGQARWTAHYLTECISPDGDDMPIDWSTPEEAQAACDARLRDEGIRTGVNDGL